MNYENFSPEAQKVINDFRGLIENIKSGKDLGTIKYYWGKGSFGLLYGTAYIMHPALTKINDAIYSYCFVARLPAEVCGNIQRYLYLKNYFLPKFSSYEDYQQNKHKCPYIKE